MGRSRERFRATMAGLRRGDPPLWEEGIREDVREAWQRQGAPSEPQMRARFRYDRRESVNVDLRPGPEVPSEVSLGDYARLREYYRIGESSRLPADWADRARALEGRDFPVGMVFTRGFFLSLAVGEWRSLEPLMYAMVDRPADVEAGMSASAELSLWAIDAVTSAVDLDFAILSEPIASFHAPVISPDHYGRFALPHYRRLADRLRAAGVDVIVAQAFGQVRVLLPLWLDIGVNALWCSHTVPAGMDYLQIRREFGTDLRLIGGIDAQALARERPDIDRAIDRVVPPLLDEGGYLPLLDDRLRPDISYANYAYYRERLERTVA